MVTIISSLSLLFFTEKRNSLKILHRNKEELNVAKRQDKTGEGEGDTYMNVYNKNKDLNKYI